MIRALLPAGLVGLLTLAGTAVWGQTPERGPRSLFPDALPRVQPLPARPGQPARPILQRPAETLPRGEAAPVETPRPIRASELAPLSPWQVGALPGSDRLARRPWGDLDPAVVRALLAAVPAPHPVTAPLDLQARILLAPLGVGQGERSLFALRLARLQELPAFEAAAELVALLPPAATDELRREVFEARLLGGRQQEACGNLQMLGESDAYTAGARLVCGLAQDEVARSHVLLGVLRERQAPYLAEVERLADPALAGDARALAAVDGPLGGLARAALRYAPLRPATAGARGIDGVALALIARNATADAGLRATAAEGAARAGRLDAARVRAALLPARGDPDGDRLRAIVDAADPATRAAALAEAWAAADDGIDRLLWASWVVPEAAGLAVTPETRAAAPVVVPALALAGDAGALRRWAALLEQPPLEDGLRAGLLPGLAVAGAVPGDALAGAPDDPWLAALLDAFGSEDAPAGDPILAALRESAPDDADDGGVPAPLEAALAEAQRRDAPAAVAVLALRALGDDPLAAGSTVAAAAVRALRGAGLEREARILAAALLLAAVDAGQPPAEAPTGSPG